MYVCVCLDGPRVGRVTDAVQFETRPDLHDPFNQES